MRVATWNMKQAVAPRRPLDDLWLWAEREIRAEVVVLTEAKVPKSGLPPGWTALWRAGGIGPRRTWGTVVAARGVELEEVTSVRIGGDTVPLDFSWPGVVVVADVLRQGVRWATIVGLYGLTVDRDNNNCGHGRFSSKRLLRELTPLFNSDRGDRIVVAGDLNLWPVDVPPIVGRLGLVDLIELTAADRDPLPGCSGCGRGAECGHLWTHRNGNSPNAAVQQIDFIFATRSMCNDLTSVTGGVQHFPDAWAVSDHAPVVAEFGHGLSRSP